MYNKLFTKILDSSIWLESSPTRIVWLTFIAVMDESGFVQFSSIGNVASRARVTVEEAQEAVNCLEEPDLESGDPDHEGRRIQRVPGGWMVLNSDKYRSLITAGIAREQTRDRVRRYRERHKENGNAVSNASVTPSETETETETETKKETDGKNARAPLTAPIHDNSHRKHAVCGRVCLNASLFGSFVRRRNTPNADQELRTWAAGVIDQWTTGAHAQDEPGDEFEFWRARYEEQWPSEAKATTSKQPAWAHRKNFT